MKGGAQTMKDGEMKSMTPKKPDKAIVDSKARIYPPNELKGQEGANMKPTEACECKAKLMEYQKTGLLPEEITALLERLRGECWLCAHSKPYDLSPTRKLSVCELGYPKARGTIAQIRDKGCIDWKLKDLKGEGK